MLQFYRSYPYGRHDPYLPSIPAALQALGRVECATTYATAPPNSRTATPLILTLISQCLLDACRKLTPECLHLSSHNRSDPARAHALGTLLQHTNVSSLVLSARSHPAHCPPHCSSPNLSQSCPALGKLLPQYFFGHDPHPTHPIFVQSMNTGPCLVH